MRDEDETKRGGSGLREAFIEAAREILREDTTLDLRKVAERAGKSRTAPYLVFGKTEEGGGLEALRLAVAVRGVRELADTAARSVARAPDPEQAARLLGEAYIDFARRRPGLFRLMFGPEVARAMRFEGAPPHGSDASDLLQARAELEGLFRRVIEGCQAVGAMGGGDTDALVLGGWAMFHGAAVLLLDGQLEVAGLATPDEAAALVTRFLMDEGALPVADAAASLLGAQMQRGAVPPGVLDAAEPMPLASRSPLVAALESPSPRFVASRAVEPEGLEGRLREAPAPYDTPSESPDLAFARTVLSRTPALRRARRMRGVIEGSRILWIDDRPELTLLERRTLEELGAGVVTAQGTAGALELLSGTRRAPRGHLFDLIISDIARPHAPRAGVEALPLLRATAPDTPVVFYVGSLDPGADRPLGSFGITNDPGELLHLVLDVLERRRV